MSYKAFVVELNDIKPHPNADRLNIATIFNETVVIGKDPQEGDKVIYFPSDGQLNEDFARHCNLLREKDENGNNTGGYMDPKKRNIKAIKLRGTYSDGIVIKAEQLAEFVGVSVDSLKAGESFSELNGIKICQKYVPHKQNAVRVFPKGRANQAILADKYPNFHEHLDTKQFAYNIDNLKEGDKFTISLKLHGTSGRTSYTLVNEHPSVWQRIKNVFKPNTTNQYEVVTGSRRVTLDEERLEAAPYRKEWHEFFKERLHKGETVYYEIVGYDGETLIMPSANNKKLNDKDFTQRYGNKTHFTYGCNVGQSQAYVYRMSMTNEDGVEVDYPSDIVALRSEQMGVPHAPILVQGEIGDDIFQFTIEELKDMVKELSYGADPNDNSHIREGVVVRLENKLDFTAYKHKSIDFKILEGIIKESAETPDREELESL